MAGEQLRVTEGKESGRQLIVRTGLLIGREAPDDAGRLGGDVEISRRHAHVSRDADGQLAIEDLGSSNGTFVNDERVSGRRMLEPGDVIRLGKTVLEVADAPINLPELVVTDGAARGRRLKLTDELVIGRAVDGVGSLGDDFKLSRRHARFALGAGGRLTVEDLGSANGTFVNGKRLIGPQVLGVGDVVGVGSTTLQVTDAELAPLPPAALRPPAPPAARAPQALPSANQEFALPLGSVFAGCRVQAVINRGDMGIVYRAEELALQRPVALKLILPEYSGDERFRERFRRESKIAAAIDHPNVIPIFDAGEEQGVLYIMMRLVDGTDLRTVIAGEGRLEPLRAAQIVRKVGAALDAAHARGMLHRDVKPSNVLLARRDHVYLSDFGLAKTVASREALTRNQTVVARLDYLAPEQILNQRVDARADVFALGCLLFEALTGEPPFARSAGGPGVLARLDAPPPSPIVLRPGLAREFNDVVRRALAHDPNERYPSAGDLGQAALVAAGAQRRAPRESVVATGAAAPGASELVAAAPLEMRPASVPDVAQTHGPDPVRWATALLGLAFVAVCMVAALHGISTL